MPIASVIIPCFNKAPYLAEALASIARQTRPVDEVIVVDDCSTDGSADIAERHGARVVRLTTNVGAAAAANVGARMARGDLLLRLDADDAWDPEHCATLLALAERHPEAGAYFTGTRFMGSLTGDCTPALPEGLSDRPFLECFKRVPGTQIASMVPRHVLARLEGYTLPEEPVDRYADDFEFWMRLAREHPIACTHTVTTSYRIHGAQLSSHPDRQLVAYFRARMRMRTLVRDGGDDALVEAMDAFVLQLWRAEIGEMWSRRATQWMRWYVALAPLVPGLPRAEVRRFAWRSRLPSRLLVAADRVRRVAAGIARPVRARVA